MNLRNNTRSKSKHYKDNSPQNKGNYPSKNIPPMKKRSYFKNKLRFSGLAFRLYQSTLSCKKELLVRI